MFGLNKPKKKLWIKARKKWKNNKRKNMNKNKNWAKFAICWKISWNCNMWRRCCLKNVKSFNVHCFMFNVHAWRAFVSISRHAILCRCTLFLFMFNVQCSSLFTVHKYSQVPTIETLFHASDTFVIKFPKWIYLVIKEMKNRSGREKKLRVKCLKAGSRAPKKGR